MIDARRWVIVETWLALGLRLEWTTSWDRIERDEFMRCDETDQHYFYEGRGVWKVLERPENARVFRSLPAVRCPALGAETLSHELAHYMVATPEQREKMNFGLSVKTTLDGGEEERAVLAEQVIDTMLIGVQRIWDTAMTRKPWERG